MHVRPLLFPLVFVCAASLAFAQAPALGLTGPDTFAEGSLGIYQLTGGTASCAWISIPQASDFQAGQTYVMTGTPGQYTLICLAVSGNTPVILRKSTTITGLEPPVPPNPSPGPGPSPNPGPTPRVKAKLAIVIYDTTVQQSLPPGQLAIWTSQTISRSLLANGVIFMRLDAQNPVLQSAQWRAVIASNALPMLVTLDAMNKPINSGPLPPDEAALVKLVTAK